jgi:Uncharacterized protein conserved in bacteria
MKAIFSKADILLFILLLLVAAGGIALMPGGGEAQTAVIRQDGVFVKEVPLNADQTFWVGDVEIAVKDGAIAFIASDCPGRECVHAGWLKSPGDTAACLPNRVSIAVSGESGVDAIAN